MAQDALVEVRITNQTAEAATIYWVNTDGAETKYSVVNPGQTYPQGTYSGHQWRAKGANDRVLGNFTVPPGGGDWVIGGMSATPVAKAAEAAQVTAGRNSLQATMNAYRQAQLAVRDAMDKRVPEDDLNALLNQVEAIAQNVKQASGGRGAVELSAPVVSAAFYHSGKIYFFHQGKYIVYGASRDPQPGFPKNVSDTWGDAFSPSGAYVNPDGKNVTFYYSVQGVMYWATRPIQGSAPNTGPSGELSSAYPGIIGGNLTGGTALNGGVYLFAPRHSSEPVVGSPGTYQILNPTTNQANEQFRGEDGRYHLPRIPSLFPGLLTVDASFLIPESQDLYLFSGAFYWVYNQGTKSYRIEGEPIDEISWPRFSFKGGAAPVALESVKLEDLAGVWQNASLSIVIADIQDAYRLRWVNSLAQGIESLKGSRAEREAARAEWPTTLVGTDPRAMTSIDSSNGTTEYKLINPKTLEIRFPQGGGKFDTYLFEKKSGVVQAPAAGGVSTFDHEGMTLEGHPALTLSSGAVEFSFKPDAPSGPLFNATGRFYMDYDENGLVTFNGRIEAPITLGQWHHVIVSSDGFVTNVAVNGKGVGSVQESIDMGQERRINFGLREGTAYQGQMKNVRIWNAAMPVEVLAPLAGKVLVGSSDLSADLKPFLLAEDGKILLPASDWQAELKDKTVYIVAQVAVPFGERMEERRAAITLTEDTDKASPYVAMDSGGLAQQIFKITPAGKDYFTLVNHASNKPVEVAEAKEEFKYGNYTLQSSGVTTNISVSVKGRHLAQAAKPSKDRRHAEFRFLRQAFINASRRLELVWIIQSRAAAESAVEEKNSYGQYGSFRVSDSLHHEVVQLESHALGATFMHSPYKAGEPKQRLFTIFPASLSSLRPKAVKLAEFPKKLKELRERQAAYAELSATERMNGSSIWPLPSMMPRV